MYASISPFGSSGTSQMIRAVVNVTSGNDTFEGAPGAKTNNKVSNLKLKQKTERKLVLKIYALSSKVLTVNGGLLRTPSPNLV